MVLAEYLLPSDIALRTVDLLAQYEIDVWVFSGERWMVRRPGGPYVGHEEHTVGFPPSVVDDFRPYLDGVGKIVGVSDDFDRSSIARASCGRRSARLPPSARSQSYYLDITHPRANKGTAVAGAGRASWASRRRASPPSATASTTSPCSRKPGSVSPWAMPSRR